MNAIEELSIVPEVEVSAKAKRRRFTAKYKLEILQRFLSHAVGEAKPNRISLGGLRDR